MPIPLIRFKGTTHHKTKLDTELMEGWMALPASKIASSGILYSSANLGIRYSALKADPKTVMEKVPMHRPIIAEDFFLRMW